MGGWEYRKEDEVDICHDGYPPPNPSDWAGPNSETEGIKGGYEYPVAGHYCRNRSWTWIQVDED